MPKIKVHEKTLGHLSRGLYRSPASALRELVSNAWDANATIVHINTNYPNFLQLTIQDNGDGFTRDEFKRLMEGGIGNSEKPKRTQSLIHGRPIIGRIGIGMLGIAQLTGAFTIISKTATGAGFKARVRLYDLLKKKLDENDSEVVKADATATDAVEVKEVDLGTYDFDETFDPATVKRGTTLIADDVHPTFAHSFQQSLKFEAFKEPPLDWGGCVKIVSKVHSLQELGDYWRLIWELAASCPVPYLSSQALPSGLIKEEQERLVGYDFAVLVDSRKLLKPVNLKSNAGGYTPFKIEEQDRKVYGKALRFHGYIVVQEGAQLKPDELRGILLRIKNVAIGYYDPSMLDYRTNEGPRSRWLTGEVFVDEGLSDALNIDRDSFNRVNPEFRAVQEHVHKCLKTVFSDVWRNIEVRSKERAKVTQQARKKHLTEVISEVVERPVTVKTGTPTDDESPEVVINEKRDKMEIELPPAESLKTKKSQKQLASAILALFEVALREKDGGKRKEVFTHLLLDLLAGW